MGIIKKYYRIQFKLTSPLSVGCGKNNVTDSDIILDSRELPYIPGSSLAGVYRRLFSAETAERYFGPELTEERIRKSSKEGKNFLTDSKVAIYDACILEPEKRVVTKRDMVALDRYKVAMLGAKFDMQILEPGVEFLTYIEQTMEKEDEQYLSDEIAYAWQQGRVKLGAKTGRGYGQTAGVKISDVCFNLSEKDGLERWLKFDMYGDDSWKELTEPPVPECLSCLPKEKPEYTELAAVYEGAGIRLNDAKPVNIRITLKQVGGISIRQYMTDIESADYLQMKRNDGTPVIPGTSWAGALQAHMAKLDPSFAKNSQRSELFFGKVKEKTDAECHKSRVTFSESELKKGEWKTYTRNAIDRFTGGTVDGALYTEKTYYYGTTELEITCDFAGIKEEDIRIFGKALAGTIVDLDNGYMSVGGLTAVGHGIFQVTEVSIDGKSSDFSGKKGQELYAAIELAVTGEGR